MGFRISYLATKQSPESIAAAFDLEVAAIDVSNSSDDNWIGILKSSGWSRFWSEDETFFTKRANAIAASSKDMPAYVCGVNETSMYCSAEYWTRGSRQWCVSHDNGSGMDHLEVIGSPPGLEAERSAQLDALRNDPDPCDYFFEIPLNLADAEICFRHEGPSDPSILQVTHIVKRPKRSLLGRLIGSRR